MSGKSRRETRGQRAAHLLHARRSATTNPQGTARGRRNRLARSHCSRASIVNCDGRRDRSIEAPAKFRLELRLGANAEPVERRERIPDGAMIRPSPASPQTFLAARTSAIGAADLAARPSPPSSRPNSASTAGSRPHTTPHQRWMPQRRRGGRRPLGGDSRIGTPRNVRSPQRRPRGAIVDDHDSLDVLRLQPCAVETRRHRRVREPAGLGVADPGDPREALLRRRQTTTRPSTDSAAAASRSRPQIPRTFTVHPSPIAYARFGCSTRNSPIAR